LTPEDINNAFRKYVDPKKLVNVHAGDFNKAKKDNGEN
jgi:predicted Zn-dependent peptidase